MITLSAYYGSVALGVTDFPLPAIADQIATLVSGRYQFQQNRRITRAFAGIPDGTVCRLDAPSFNRFVRPIIAPIDADATVGGNLPAVYDCGDTGPVIPKLENLAPLVSRAGAGAANCLVGLWHQERYDAKPPGTITSVRATANATGAAGAWQLGQLTFDQALPNSNYYVVGMQVTGANCVLGRLVFPGSVERPGCLCNVDATAWVFNVFRFGNMGLLGQFTNTNPPQIEILGTGAVAAQAVVLDLIPASALI